MDEIWKPVRGFEMYEVSNFGEVRSLPRNGTVLKPRKMMGFIDSSGYHQVLLTSYRIHKKIHRLVGEAFIPNPENKPCINHINKIKTDNRVTNLEWATYSENTQHAYDTGYKAQQMEDHSQSKLDEIQIFCIMKCINDGISKGNVAVYFNITQDTIRNILLGKHWINRKYQIPSMKHHVKSNQGRKLLSK